MIHFEFQRKQKTSKNKVVPLGEFQSRTEGEVTVEDSGGGEEQKDGVSGKDVENGEGSLDSDLEDTSGEYSISRPMPPKM